MTKNLFKISGVKAALALATAASLVGFMFAAPLAFAGVGGSVVPDYPNPVTAGQTGLTANLVITNGSTNSNSAESVSVTNIMTTPSCGAGTARPCVVPNLDTGVFTVHDGTGRAGTACAGVVFTASAPDGTTGEVVFTPSSAIILGPANIGGPAATCIIDFTVDVLKVPTKDSNSIASGVQTRQFASADFQGLTSGLPGAGSGTSEATVNPASPTIATTPSAGGGIGTVLNDTATLSGGSSPTGNVTFKLFPPSDATCSGAAVYTDADGTVPYDTATSGGGFTSNTAGTYHWTAAYAGDSNNNATSSPCSAETVVVDKVSPGIQTTPSAGGPIGTVLNDTAALSGGSSPTGNVTFKLFPPSDATCSGAAVYTDADGTAPYDTGTSLGGYTSLVVGTYHWTADYAGDANNNAVSSGCQDEPVVVDKVTPTIATTPSAGGGIGTQVHDSATVSGGASPTGTVTFNLYGAGDATCASPAIFTDVQPLSGGTASSTNFTLNAIGTYHWIASYSGDANNNPAVSGCADETVVISQATPTLTTTASGSVTIGGSIHDTAHLSGGSSPTGTISFQVFGPGDTTCATPLAPAPTGATVSGNGDYDSGNFTANSVGTYLWIASYSGDANNAAVSTACNDNNESVAVTKASPTISTTPTPATGTLGTILNDTAALSGGSSPTGNVTFKLFPPSDATCSGTAVYTEVDPSSPYGTSPGYTSLVAGTYRWTADYAGDANNNAVSSGCQDEPVTITSNPSTIVNITSSSPTTTLGSTITLTVTEQNDGDVNLTSPSVVVTNGTTTLYTLVAPPTSGDTNTNGILDVGETWSWTISGVVVNADTTFTATGHGLDPSLTDITFPLDQQEQASVFVDAIAPQYCSPGYWKNHPGSWVGFSPTDSFFTVFGEHVTIMWSSKGKPKPVTDPTLQQALEANGGGINALVRATVNALLNTSAGLNTGWTTASIISAFQAVYPGTDAQYAALASQFIAPENCPLN